MPYEKPRRCRFAAGDAQEIPEVDLGGPKTGAGQGIQPDYSNSLPTEAGAARPSGHGGELTYRGLLIGTWMEKIDIDPLSTHKIPLGDSNQACDLMHVGRSIR